MSLSPEPSLLQVGGGPESEAVLGTLEKQLICPICLEIFNKPVVILPCQHNLCRKCANELYQPSLFQARTTMMVSSGRFRCPSCRQEVVLDRHGVYGLQRNLLVENIIDAYKRQISNATSSSPPLQPPAEATCSDHEGEKLNIYCLTCQLPTCSLCKVFGAHQSCEVAPLTDVYQQQKDELSEGVGSLVTVNDKVQAVINELEETCRTIEANCQTQKQSLCEKFSRMFAVLEARQKAMTQQISSEQEEKTGHAQSLAHCYGDSVEANSKLLERAMSSMEETDMAEFVQTSKELITKVTAATASCPTVMLKPGFENMRRYRFNFIQQQRALQSIDFIKLEEEEPPEEPQEEPEPEEPKEPSIQNLEPKLHEEPSFQIHESNHLQDLSVQNLEPNNLQKLSIQNLEPQHLQEPYAQNLEPKQLQELSVQNLESAAEPVKELVPVLTAAAALGLAKDCEEPAAEELQPEDEGGLMQEEEKETDWIEEVRGGCDPVQKGNRGERPEGMSTLQSEGTETKDDAGDWTSHSEMKEKQDAQDGEEEETDVTFYPSWYKPSCRYRVHPGLPDPAKTLSGVHDPEESVCSPPEESSTDSPTDAKSQTEALGTVQIQVQPQLLPCHPCPSATETQIQFHPSLTPTSKPFTLDEKMSYTHQSPQELSSQFLTQPPHQPPPYPDSTSQPQKKPVNPPPQVQVGQQTAESEENEEEVDMQGWVCLPGTADKSLSLVDLGEGSLDGFLENIGNTSSASTALNDGGISGPSDASESREGNSPLAETMKEEVEKQSLEAGERNEEQVSGFSESVAATENRSNTEDDGPKGDDCAADSRENTNGFMWGVRDGGFESSGEEKREPVEESKRTEDTEPKAEGSAGTAAVSVQAVTLFFYLMAFLVILQRVWAYIGCFICT